jgi:zinc transport system substrate-binding protein
LTVTAAFAPVAAAAEAIGGECVVVTNLTPPGVEPHDLELTPDDAAAIASAGIVLYMGSGFQPAVEDALGDAEGVTADVLALAETVPATPEEADGGLAVDPHVWLDPGLWADVMPRLGAVMADAAPQADCDFAANAAAYAKELETIDEAYSAGLADCSTTVLVTNHAAFGYLASAYGLTQEAISGLQPEAEPTPARLAELKELVEANGVTTIFTEELVSPDVAETLADEAGVRTAVLDTLEGATAGSGEAGDDYGSRMRTNLKTLRSALGCS